MNDSAWKTYCPGMICAMLLFAVLAGPRTGLAVGMETNRTDGIKDAEVAATDAQRDPFWPVGYRPKRVATVEPMDQKSIMTENDGISDWNRAMQSVDIQGVSSRAESEFYAVINGEVKSRGDTVSVEVGGTVYTWEIQSISPPNSVKMRRMSSR